MNDLELIRNFRSQVEPPDDERIAAARAALVSELVDVPGRRRGRAARRRPVLVALLAAPAIAAAVALLIVGPAGEGGAPIADAAIIRHADAALSPPPHEILHTKEIGDGSWPSGGS